MSHSVLVVDDDISFREIAARVLTSWGHRVVGEAGSVAEALERADALRPDAALVDVGLPDGDGLDLARRLAGMAWDVRVVVISADGDQATARAARSVGAVGFVGKDDLTGPALRCLFDGPDTMHAAAAPPLRVAIGEDDVLFREGVARILSDAGLDVVATAGDADDLINRTLAYRPDVVVVDVRMPPQNEYDGLHAAVQIRQRLPGIGVVVLSQYLEPALVLELIGDHAEGVGYLLKERVGDVRTFTDALVRVAAGGSVLDPEVVRRMLGHRAMGGRLAGLSTRELEVLAAMAEGKSNAGIARSMFVSLAAVEKHVTAIFRKLNLASESTESTEHRRVHAVLTYLHEGKTGHR